jgi:hypothetical protein
VQWERAESDDLAEFLQSSLGKSTRFRRVRAFMRWLLDNTGNHIGTQEYRWRIVAD